MGEEEVGDKESDRELAKVNGTTDQSTGEQQQDCQALSPVKVPDQPTKVEDPLGDLFDKDEVDDPPRQPADSQQAEHDQPKKSASVSRSRSHRVRRSPSNADERSRSDDGRRSPSKTDGAGDGPPQARGGRRRSRSPGSLIDDFIRENKLDEKCAEVLRSLPPQAGRQVVLDGFHVAHCKNPSAVVMSRVRKVSSGIGKGSGKASRPPARGGGSRSRSRSRSRGRGGGRRDRDRKRNRSRRGDRRRKRSRDRDRRRRRRHGNRKRRRDGKGHGGRRGGAEKRRKRAEEDDEDESRSASADSYSDDYSA